MLMTSTGSARSLISFLILYLGGFMLLSLSLMIVVGFILGEGFKLLKLPYIIGYLMAGILLGLFGLIYYLS